MIERLAEEERLSGAVIHAATVYLAGQVADDPSLADYRPEPYTSLLVKMAREHAPEVLLFPTTSRGRELAAMSAAERGALGPMHPGRVDVIVAGALILREVVRAVGTGLMVASEQDILDGIALSLAR